MISGQVSGTVLQICYAVVHYQLEQVCLPLPLLRCNVTTLYAAQWRGGMSLPVLAAQIWPPPAEELPNDSFLRPTTGGARFQFKRWKAG